MTIPNAIFVIDKKTNVLYERKTSMKNEDFSKLLFFVANISSSHFNSVVPDSNFIQRECEELNQRVYLFSLTNAKMLISYDKEGTCLITEHEFISSFFGFLTALKELIDFNKKGFVEAIKFVNFTTVIDEIFNSELTVIPTLDEIQKIMNLYSVNERLGRILEEEKMKAMAQQFEQFSLLKEMMEGENAVAPNSSEAFRIKRKETKKLEREKKEREEKLKLEKGEAIENGKPQSEEDIPTQTMGLKLR